jgi:hypothetical protein
MFSLAKLLRERYMLGGDVQVISIRRLIYASAGERLPEIDNVDK